MKTSKEELKEYFKHSIQVNLKHFETLSRKYLDYKLERMGMQHEKIQFIETGLDPLRPEIIHANFKVDEYDIVVKKSINQREPEKLFILIECEDCHEINERSFDSILELMLAIEYLSSHSLHKSAKCDL